MHDVRVILVGDADRTEFRDSLSALKRAAAVECAADVNSALAALDREGAAPAAIVVAQSFPGQLSHEAVDRLRRAAPLARIIELTGAWCEGQMRSAEPWPATARAYWHQFPIRCRMQLPRLIRGESCSWSLPATATDEERLLADTTSPVPMGEAPGVRASKGSGFRVRGFGGLVVVRCRSVETWDWLAAACRRRDLAAVRQRDLDVPSMDGATAVIFDCGSSEDADLEALGRLAAALRPAPVVALMSFPRIEDHDRALAAGAAAVVSKPLLEDDLFSEMAAVDHAIR